MSRCQRRWEDRRPMASDESSWPDHFRCSQAIQGHSDEPRRCLHSRISVCKLRPVRFQCSDYPLYPSIAFRRKAPEDDCSQDRSRLGGFNDDIQPAARMESSTCTSGVSWPFAANSVYLHEMRHYRGLMKIRAT